MLVDIFVRDSSGIIGKIKDSTHTIDTHTIVLFKNPDGKLIVIDPSNSSLSSHIADLYNVDIFADTDFYVPKREIRIYEGDKEAGYRDCVDIAVKIASGLQQHEGGIKWKKMIVGDKIEEVIDFGSIPVMQEVTNNSKLNPGFPDDIGVVKIRQASDITIREKIDSILPILQTQERFVIKHGTEFLTQAFQEAYHKVLLLGDSGTAYEECVAKLLAATQHIDSYIE